MMSPWQRKLTLGAVRLLPRNTLSRLLGRLAELRLPGPLMRLVIRIYGRFAGVDFSEVRDPLSSFATLQSFFTRALCPGARPIDADPMALVAPCDGAWGASGQVRDGALLQIKGRPYSLGALLGADRQAAHFEGGQFATFYLSPRDYHRFHMPLDGQLTAATYLPGTLWPVNRAGVEGIDGLFAQNERLCAFFDLASGGRLALVAVGATVVGKVRVSFDDLTTNLRGATAVRRTYGGQLIGRGVEWGRFELGSTIILVATADALCLDTQSVGTPLRLGQRIGHLPTTADNDLP